MSKWVVFATAKILIWKQFTTYLSSVLHHCRCVCNCKDTNLKAIHNGGIRREWRLYVVFATAKILIWKQFTTAARSLNLYRGCVCNCKDTNLKAIHNSIPIPCRAFQGCVCNCKDTNLKAIHNSKLCSNSHRWGCVCNCKDTNLKAIHNTSSSISLFASVVFATAKILIWKQFTTLRCDRLCRP